MAHTRTLETHKPSGDTFVVERDEQGRIIAVSDALHYSEWRDEVTGGTRDDFDPRDTHFEPDHYDNSFDNPDAAEFLAGFA